MDSKNTLENDIFESFLKMAVYENGLNELKKYSFADTNDIQVSAACDKKIRRIQRNLHYKHQAKQFFHTARKCAVLFCSIIGLIFILFLYSDEVRASCYKMIVNIYDKYIEFLFEDHEDAESNTFQIGYIPEGYYLKENIVNEYKTSFNYVNSSGDEILIYCLTNSGDTLVDNEHYDIKDIKVQGSNGKLFLSKSAEFPNYLLWYGENGCYMLYSTLDESIMLKIASNIE